MARIAGVRVDPDCSSNHKGAEECPAGERGKGNLNISFQYRLNHRILII